MSRLLWHRLLIAGATVGCAALLLSCVDRSFGIPPDRNEKQETKYYPQSIEKDVDLLFVIDNSGSMEHEQQNLAANFPKLIEALRSEKLEGKIPNVHIGVISSDVGAGTYGLPSCELAGGDGGKLQAKPQKAGCTPPDDAWISYIDGNTNIPSGNADQVERVKEAFSCIAELGIDGCGFEGQLESARRALDKGLNVNPGFLRENAFLAIVFITDEDDCSAKNPTLFDPSQQGLTDPLGPLTSFRCFEFGIQCDVPKDKAREVGARNNCVPAYDWLYSVNDYIKFFEGLKPSKDRIIMAAIAGPVDPVSVGRDGENPTLKPSCSSTAGFAVPGIRLKAVIDAFDGLYTSICTTDFGPALDALGSKIVASLGGQCIGSPLLTAGGGLACFNGVPTTPGQKCTATCLDQVDCIIEQVTGRGTAQQKTETVEKCPPRYFEGSLTPDGKSFIPKVDQCEDDCKAMPGSRCWRIVPRPGDCVPEQLNTTPFGLQVMRVGKADSGTVAVARCKAATFRWGSETMAKSSLTQCE